MSNSSRGVTMPLKSAEGIWGFRSVSYAWQGMPASFMFRTKSRSALLSDTRPVSSPMTVTPRSGSFTCERRANTVRRRRCTAFPYFALKKLRMPANPQTRILSMIAFTFLQSYGDDGRRADRRGDRYGRRNRSGNPRQAVERPWRPWRASGENGVHGRRP